MYKSIMLSNREHTREVICSAMLKHGLEGSPDDYNLAQMLPDKGKGKFKNSTMCFNTCVILIHDTVHVVRSNKEIILFLLLCFATLYIQ